MKNKLGNFIGKNLYLVFSLLVVVMMFVPVPVVALEVLSGVELAVSLGIYIYTAKNHRKLFCDFVIYFTLFSLAVNVSFTRAAIISFDSGNQTFLDKVFVYIFFTYPKNPSYILKLIIALSLTCLLIMTSVNLGKKSENWEKASLDYLNQELLGVDKKLDEGTISQKEAEEWKTKLTEDIDFCSSLEKAAKFYYSNIKVIIVLVLVNLTGGLLISIPINKMNILTALPVVLNITSENLMVFAFPQISVGLAINLNFKLQDLQI